MTICYYSFISCDYHMTMFYYSSTLCTSSLILKCPPPPKRYQPSFHSSFQVHPTETTKPTSEANLTSTPKEIRSPDGKSPNPLSNSMTSSRTCPTISVTRTLFTSNSTAGCTSSKSTCLPLPTDNPSLNGIKGDKNHCTLTVPVECYVTEC